MSAQLDDRDREILEHLRLAGGAEISSLCELLGVTRTAIRQRLGRLESAGFVVAESRSQLRGRPRHWYRVTATGAKVLGENYRELVEVLWEAITGESDQRVRSNLLARVRDGLADRFSRGLSSMQSLDERVDGLAGGMRSGGYRIESVRSEGLQILRETCCPFPELVDDDETICQVEREVFEKVLGASVEFKSRCHDGQGCCDFHVQRSDAGDASRLSGIGFGDATNSVANELIQTSESVAAI